MKRPTILVMYMRQAVAAVASVLLLLEAYGGEPGDAGPVQSQIQMLPQSPEASEDRSLKQHLQKRLKDPKLAETAATKAFHDWNVFKDDYISFRYPVDPHITVEVESPDDQIPILGGPVGTTENTFFRGYRFALGEHTYPSALRRMASARI